MSGNYVSDTPLLTELNQKRIYTIEEITAILGVSKTTTYQLVKSGVFHSVRVGGQYRISKKSFDKWLDNAEEF